MKIVGISGKRESGKSSLAKFLEKDYGWTRVSLAEPLKEHCKNRWGLTDAQVYGAEKESTTKYRRTDGSYYTPRDILIREGCLARSISPDYWCDMLKAKIDYLAKDKTNQIFVIDDIRFINEIEYFKHFNSKFVRLERRQSAIGKAALDDLSETELDSFKLWDAILLEEFNRDLDDLKRFAEYLYLHIVNKTVYDNDYA